MASGLLSLKWNNHRTTFFHVLSTVRSKEAYCDVTLACDGKFYPVHKLVLSTCSDYFERMFERTNCKHPIIVLKDIRHDELEALLNYMYVGEVNVLQNELAGLIKAAECLMIKGLAVPDEAPVKDSKRSSFNREDSPHAKRRRRDDDGRSSSHNQHLQRESSSQRQYSSASLPNPSSRLPPPPSPSASVGSASDTLSEDISQSQSENNAQEPAKRPGKEKTSSQSEEVPEVYIDEAGVKEEPTEIEDEEEITETKEMLDPEFSFEPLPEGDSRSDPGGGSGDYDSQVLSSQPQSMEDLVAQAIPGSSGLQGNSLWEGDGSLQGFPIEGYSGDGSRPPQMVAKNAHAVQCFFRCARCKMENKVGEKDFLNDVASDDLNYYFRCPSCGFLSMVTKHSWQNGERIKQDPTRSPLGKKVLNFQVKQIKLAPKSFADNHMQVLSYLQLISMGCQCTCSKLEKSTVTESESLAMNEVKLEFGTPEENVIKLEPLSPCSRESVVEGTQVNDSCLKSFTLQDNELWEKKRLCSPEETRKLHSPVTQIESIVPNQVKVEGGTTQEDVIFKLEEPLSPFSGEALKEEPHANDTPLQCAANDTDNTQVGSKRYGFPDFIRRAADFEPDQTLLVEEQQTSYLKGENMREAGYSTKTNRESIEQINISPSPGSYCSADEYASQQITRGKCHIALAEREHDLDNRCGVGFKTDHVLDNIRNDIEFIRKALEMNSEPKEKHKAQGCKLSSAHSSKEYCLYQNIALATREHDLETRCCVGFKKNLVLDHIRNDIEFIKKALEINSEPKEKHKAQGCKLSSVHSRKEETSHYQSLSEKSPAKLSVYQLSERQPVVKKSCLRNVVARDLITQTSQNTVTKDTSGIRKLPGTPKKGAIRPNANSPSKKGHDISSSLRELFKLASEYRVEDTVSQNSVPLHQDRNVPSTSGKRSFNPTSPEFTTVESKIAKKCGSDEVFDTKEKMNMDIVAPQQNLSQLSQSKLFPLGLITSTPFQREEGKKKRKPKTKQNKPKKLANSLLPFDHTQGNLSCMQIKNPTVSNLDSEGKTSVEEQHTQSLVPSAYCAVGTSPGITLIYPFLYLQGNSSPCQKKLTPILPKTTEKINQSELRVSPLGEAMPATESSRSTKADLVNEISPGKYGTNAASSSCEDLPAKPSEVEASDNALDDSDANLVSKNITVKETMETNTQKDCPSSSVSGKIPSTEASPIKLPLTREAIKISRIVSAEARGKREAIKISRIVSAKARGKMVLRK